MSRPNRFYRLGLFLCPDIATVKTPNLPKTVFIPLLFYSSIKKLLAITLTFGPGKSTSNITFVEQGEVKTVQGSSRLTFKYEVEKGKANQMIAMINKITGMGLNEV